MAPGGYPSDNDRGNGHRHGEEKELWGDPVNPRCLAKEPDERWRDRREGALTVRGQM